MNENLDETRAALPGVAAAAAIAAATMLAACAAPVPCGEVQSTADRSPTATELRELQALRSVADAPAATLGVQHAGALPWVGVVGCATLGPDRPATTTDRFYAGSVTKSFTSALVLQLSSEGKVSLDDPLTTYLPELAGIDGVSVRQAMHHGSGLFNYTNLPGVFATPEPGAPPWTQQTALEEALRRPRDFAPGTKWEYSNTNYLLLGLLVEHVTAQPFRVALRQRLLDPLGLTQTIYLDGEAGDVVTGYEPRCGELACSGFDPDLPLQADLAGPAGALASTAGDLVRWDRALFEGAAIDDASRAELEAWGDTHDFLYEVLDMQQYGLGVARFEGGAFGHPGSVPGGVTLMLYDPATRLTVVGMVSTFNTFPAVVIHLVEQTLPALIAEEAAR